MFRQSLTSLAVVLVPLLVVTDLSYSAGSAKQAHSAGKFTVWVFRSVNGDWEKQEGRTLVTDDAAVARKYVERVSSVDGWTATSNLPPYEEGSPSSAARLAKDLLGTRWTYFGSLEGCIFQFLDGNRLWATSFPQMGMWRVEGKRLTIEIQNPFCEGVNVYTGEIDSLSRDMHLQVISSPYPNNVGREVILKRLPLPGFT
jgi:hypothetical protein